MISSQVDFASPLERLRSIRDRFAEDGSVASFLAVLGAVVGAWLAPYVLARLLHRRRQRQANSPRRLFAEVLRQVPLNVAQRDLIRRMATELSLAHPVMLLLSPQIFHSYANRWMSLTSRASLTTRQRLDRLAAVLFPRADG